MLLISVISRRISLNDIMIRRSEQAKTKKKRRKKRTSLSSTWWKLPGLIGYRLNTYMKRKVRRIRGTTISFLSFTLSSLRLRCTTAYTFVVSYTLRMLIVDPPRWSATLEPSSVKISCQIFRHTPGDNILFSIIQIGIIIACHLWFQL